MRRTVMRYVCLCVTMMFTMISPRVKKRFPTLDHFVDAGLLQTSEKVIIDDLNTKFPKHSKHWYDFTITSIPELTFEKLYKLYSFYEAKNSNKVFFTIKL